MRQSQKKELIKNKTVNDAVNFIPLASNEMFSFNENELEKEEPEASRTNYGKYFKKLVTVFVILYLFFMIVLEAFAKINTSKM